MLAEQALVQVGEQKGRRRGADTLRTRQPTRHALSARAEG
jgi:hypothetical protein